MQSVFDLKSGPHESHIDLQIAAYWELLRAGKTDGIIFDPETHTATVNGKPLRSVTTILHDAEMTPDGYKFIDPWYLTRGKYIHTATEFFDKGTLDEGSVDKEVLPYLNAYKAFRRDFSAQIKGIEVIMYHPVYQYFGIIDRIIEGDTCYSLHLKPRNRVPYKLVEVTNIRAHFNFFLSALIVTSDRPDRQKEIARCNVDVWRKRNLKEAA